MKLNKENKIHTVYKGEKKTILFYYILFCLAFSDLLTPTNERNNLNIQATSAKT